MENENTLLNQAQKNSVSIALRLLEENIFRIRLILAQRSYNGHLYSFRVDLDDDQISNLQEIFDNILERITAAKKGLNLISTNDLLSQSLNGSASYFWSVLIDEKSEKLKRYGDVSPFLKQELDPTIDQIITLLNRMTAVLKKSGKT
ncbi:hypothetical protein BMS3Bbin03_00081 [bacterium BMS3Bbin03]|nr:hypothetical protein BMS3Bbin03_00081 [bacterium BMS3Bbin03]